MTAQLIPSRPGKSELSDSSASSRSSSATKIDDALLMKLMKSYQADQQVKYLHLQAEIEVLWQQLQALKQQQLQRSDKDESTNK